MKKILFYSPVMLRSGGGCERWHCDITDSLQKQFNLDVRIVTANICKPQWTEEYLKKQLKVPYSVVKFPIIFSALIPTPKAFMELYEHFKWADSIHVIQGFIGQDILILILKLITGKKIVVGHHAPIFHKVWLHNIYMKYVSRFLFNFFDGHMTLNSSDKKFLEDKWNIKNVHFIPSGIRVEKFLNIKRNKHPNLNFITVGIYRPQKGLDLLMEAIEMFNRKFPQNKAVFRIVGGGMQKPLIADYVKRNKNILDLGYVKYEDMPKVYEKSDIYLLSSREEPFGLVLIEGWSSGMPALATKTEGPLDMVLPGKNGWLIDSIDAKGINEKICEVYEEWERDPGAIIEMVKSCRSTGKEYSIDVTAKRMRESYFV
jgi:glycosyltransferase involved in cell wall biosynthesis